MLKLKANQVRSREFADFCFDVYLTMEPPRSLKRLGELLAEHSIKISHTTLREYSRHFGWQKRLSDAAEIAKRSPVLKAADHLVSMAEKHAENGRIMQYFANTFLSAQLKDGPKKRRVNVGDLARLMVDGSKLERLALGEATDRTEVRLEAFNLVVAQVIDVFTEVAHTYQIPDAAVRDFAHGAEKVVNQAMAQAESEDAFASHNS